LLRDTGTQEIYAVVRQNFAVVKFSRLMSFWLDLENEVR
jgi:hypothetical protein